MNLIDLMGRYQFVGNKANGRITSKQINFYAHVGVGITGYEIFVFRKI